VERFAGSEGPAQEQGVKAGWFLDLRASASGCSALQTLLAGWTGVDVSRGSDRLVEAAFKDPEDLLKKLNGPLRAASDMVLTFRSSASHVQVRLLPEVHAKYGAGQRVSGEVKLFNTEARKVKVEAFLKKGPAQAAGVRTDWVLDIHKTFEHSPGMTPSVTEEALIENPNILLAMSDVTLVFKQPNPSKTQKFMCQGPADPEKWKYSSELPGGSADFTFISDGDGADDPSKRWGFWALVLPDGHKAPSKTVLDKLAADWTTAAQKAAWVEEPEIQRDEWDEARLRALCAKHGWEFEWMTEDGERRRRAKEVAKLEADQQLADAAKLAARSAQSRPSLSSKPGGEALPDGATATASTG